ncbi:UPF0711 protein C18orf21 homolog isoform X1 [Syngnathus scovelli]|uniref:UPF0711 protein C18orf21 homolog isoform X1 n=1 Tax=Syngnathus scovelli TaxID=161590 RepID=UPI002110B9BE|nr:UPF0711 protein C18orf21 homolog isoform X1 [Syngnathus scovelli]
MSFKSKDLSDMFRFNASLLFQESCPEESRFFLEKYFACLDKKKPGSSAVALDKTLVCQYCFQLLRPDNQRLRLKPKRRPSARVQRLLWRRAEGKALSLLQKRRLHHFWTSSSVLPAAQSRSSKTVGARSQHLRGRPKHSSNSRPVQSSVRDGHLPRVQQDNQTQRNEPRVFVHLSHSRQQRQAQDHSVDQQIHSRQGQGPPPHPQVVYILWHARLHLIHPFSHQDPLQGQELGGPASKQNPDA